MTTPATSGGEHLGRHRPATDGQRHPVADPALELLHDPGARHRAPLGGLAGHAVRCQEGHGHDDRRSDAGRDALGRLAARRFRSARQQRTTTPRTVIGFFDTLSACGAAAARVTARGLPHPGGATRWPPWSRWPACAGRSRRTSSSARTTSDSTSSQVRRYTALLRHTVLAMAALAVCAVTAAAAATRHRPPAPLPTRPDQPPPLDPGLIPLTVAEIKRLFNLITRRHLPEEHHRRWGLWRRRHQARARWFHHRARLQRQTS